jgi:hypothetical protein
MREKTFKREVALLCLVWLVYIVETKDVEVINVLAWPIFSYVAAAFGFDAFGKLRDKSPKPSGGRGAECSGEYSDR